jgi:hypothetical protein
MSALITAATVLVWALIFASPALVVLRAVRAHKAEQRAHADRTRNYRPGPKTYTI